MEILAEYALEIFFGLVSAGALAFCRHVGKKNKELNEIMKADQNRQYRQMILDEIEPLIEEIHRVQKTAEQKIANLEKHHDGDMIAKTKEIELLQKKNEKNMEMIIASYKFRLIQLCKVHLRDGWITQDEFDQVTEMYKLYHGLGGNGQAQEYYDRVMELDIVKEPPHNRRAEDEK